MGDAMYAWGQGIYRKSIYFLLNFSMTLSRNLKPNPWYLIHFLPLVVSSVFDLPLRAASMKKSLNIL